MRRRRLIRDLAGVRHDAPFAIDLAERRQRKFRRRGERARLVLLIDRPEEEQPIGDDASAHAGAVVVIILPLRVDGAVRRVQLLPSRFESARFEIAEQRSAIGVRAALRHDVDDAARRLAELRFEAGRLHLRLLDEVGGDAGAERSEHDRVGADAAVAGVRDVDAVDDVGVFEAAGAADRRIGFADAAAVADAGQQIQRIGEVASDRKHLDDIAADDAADGGGRGVDDGWRTLHLHDLGDAAGLQDDLGQGDALAEPDGDVGLLDRREAGEFDASGVGAWRQIGREEATVVARDVALDAFIGSESNGRAGNRCALCVDDESGNGAARCFLRQARSGACNQQCQCHDE
jgi:hypothetical protein